ncbi:hypothetical protein CA54_39940 [Symmachiella macrocystis]|uniref:Uncharacterized protein n=1 Tax=Symmachiella macrocystis TaxID=2527985 RepID=A0A5C6BAL6_9PLAN|nr:hypothetical protein [Symmachiella macrocystis]TWU08757.1 hypothetical protein CA54_39940 [Symmachiella macrocystis]
MSSLPIRKITLALLIGQLFCWLVFLYTLYFYVPAYAKVHDDYDAVAIGVGWQALVAICEWIVVNTPSDSVFPLYLFLFLVAIAGGNLYVGSPSYTEKWWVVWSIVGFAIPCLLLVFEFVTVADLIRRTVDRHPEIRDYEIWWINILL